MGGQRQRGRRALRDWISVVRGSRHGDAARCEQMRALPGRVLETSGAERPRTQGPAKQSSQDESPSPGMGTNVTVRVSLSIATLAHGRSPVVGIVAMVQSAKPESSRASRTIDAAVSIEKQEVAFIRLLSDSARLRTASAAGMEAGSGSAKPRRSQIRSSAVGKTAKPPPGLTQARRSGTSPGATIP